MSTWWLVGYGKITPVEVIKFTEKSVWIPCRSRTRDRRESRVSNGYVYMPTWESAHAHLLAVAEERVRDARLHLDRCNGFLGNIRGMKMPTETTP